jgi:lipoprotein-releasing system permease protein
MKKNLEIFVAIKYLKGRRKSIFSLFSTVIGISGIALGVAALIVTLGVMNGFNTDIREKILGLNPHIIIMGNDIEGAGYMKDKLSRVEGIQAIAPFVYGQSVVKTKHAALGVLLKGIDFDLERNVVPLEKIPVEGKWFGPKASGIVLGKELVRNAGIGLGDEVILVSPSESDFIGMSMPKLNKFTLEGIFNSGMYDYDSNLAYVDINKAKEIFSLKGVTGYGIRLRNINKTESIAREIRSLLPYRVLTWQELNRNLFSALKLEKIVMFLLLALIIVVACFNVVSNLLLMSIEKAKEIGIFSAIGLRRSAIRRIFIYEGFITGLLGTFVGTVLGISISELLKRYQFIKLPPEVYYLDRLPVRLSFADVASVAAVAVAITVLSSIYPADRASRLDPVEIIRYG